MNKLWLAILCADVCGAAKAGPFPAAESAIRAFANNPSLELTYVETESSPEILNSVGSNVANPYHQYKTSDGCTYRIDSVSNIVIYFDSPSGLLKLHQNPSVFEAVADQFASSHISAQTLAQYTKVAPGLYYKKQAGAVLNFYDRITIIVYSDEIVHTFYHTVIPTPTYTGTTVLTKDQAMKLASNYLAGIYDVPVTYTLSTIYQNKLLIYQPDDLGVWQPAWKFFYEISTVTDDPEDQWSEGYNVYVNAVDGSVFDDREQWLGGIIDSKPKYGKQIGFRILLDGTIIRTGKHTDVPIGWLQALAKGHKLSAKAGEKAFTLDGKRIALPAKVTAKAGTLYLPWQALKSLPGIKCSYDAKLNRLDITTAKAAKSATKPAAAK